jgi:hypothetical protein
MATEAIPLSRLAANLGATLSECADSGRAVVVELPDHRLVAIRPFDPDVDDDLTDDLLASNPAFRTLVEKSAASERRPFLPARDAEPRADSDRRGA